VLGASLSNTLQRHDNIGLCFTAKPTAMASHLSACGRLLIKLMNTYPLNWLRSGVLLCLLLGSTFISFTTKATAAPAKVKLLIIDGASNHDWKHRLAQVREILARDGSFDVDVSITPSTADDPVWAKLRPDFAKYDVVLSGYNNLGGKPGWPKEVQQAFEKFVRDGGGFYVYHEANNSFAEWPEYNQMIGLGWRKKDFGKAIVVRPDESLQIIPPGEGDDTWHGNRSDVVVHQLGEHPIHAGLPRAWKAADIEVYCYARGPATNLTVLAYAADPQTKLQFPIEWTVRYGEGRVFVSTYGHVWADQKDPKGMKCAAFQTIMVRALKWLAKQPSGESVPADFPTADAISLRQP
jgi:type 1 glutamine amidotransferase